MKRLYYFLLIIVTTAACSSVSNPEIAVNNLRSQPGVSDVQTDSIYHTLRYFPNQTQLSIAFVDDTNAVFYGAIRTADTVRTTDNKNRVFEIGSLSKVFTSTLLSRLASRKELQLDQPIQEHLDFPLNVNDSLPITFRQLANHTSGLSRLPSGFIWESMWHMDNPYKDYDEEKLRDYMSNGMELDHAPGTHFQYSNIGAGILGYVLTQVKGQSYEKMLQQMIFQPLNMPHSTTQRSLVADKLVSGLTKRGNSAANWDLGAIPGAGATLSTAEDMVQFGSANFDTSNQVLNLQQEKTYRVDEKMDIALGWFILKQDSTTHWHWHNGGTGGYRSSMALDLDRKKGVVVLSNISAGHSHAAHIDSLSFSLLRSMESNRQPLN